MGGHLPPARAGPFGFLASPSLRAQDPDNSTGTQHSAAAPTPRVAPWSSLWGLFRGPLCRAGVCPPRLGLVSEPSSRPFPPRAQATTGSRTSGRRWSGCSATAPPSAVTSSASQSLVRARRCCRARLRVCGNLHNYRQTLHMVTVWLVLAPCAGESAGAGSVSNHLVCCAHLAYHYSVCRPVRCDR